MSFDALESTYHTSFGLDFLSFGEQRGADVICIEDEHPTFSTPLRDDLALFFDKAPEVGEPYLYTLVDDLADRHQVLCDHQDTQHVHKSPVLSNMS